MIRNANVPYTYRRIYIDNIYTNICMYIQTYLYITYCTCEISFVAFHFSWYRKKKLTPRDQLKIFFLLFFCSKEHYFYKFYFYEGPILSRLSYRTLCAHKLLSPAQLIVYIRDRERLRSHQ